MKLKNTATLLAILAAVLYALNIPLSKLLLSYAEPTMMAAFLYLGAGVGMLLLGSLRRITGKKEKAEPLTKEDLPFTLLMIVLDIAAPILLMIGISLSAAENVSLMNNFEIVATSVIALVFFKEIISKRLFAAILLITVASVMLSFEGVGSLSFGVGSLFVLGACICWGFENNCTRRISGKSASQIVIIKGIFSGAGSLMIALFVGEALPSFIHIFLIMLLGFVAYGLSIFFYVSAQKELGAAKVSAYYSIAPFIGVALGMLLFREWPSLTFYPALILMIAATLLTVRDSIALQHVHPHTHVHSHEHSHGELVHSHEHSHEHTHSHIHGEEESAHTHEHEDIPEHEHIHS